MKTLQLGLILTTHSALTSNTDDILESYNVYLKQAHNTLHPLAVVHYNAVELNALIKI